MRRSSTTLPDQAMKSYVVEIEARAVTDVELAYRLRTNAPAVVGRLRDGKVVLDLRTVFPRQQESLIDAVRRALTGSA